jgi:hypothetical protein
MQRPFKELEPLEVRLTQEALKLRQDAKAIPPGIERDQLVRRARQAETGSHISAWLRSPGLQPPE